MSNKDMPAWKENIRGDVLESVDTKIMGYRMTIHKYMGCGDSLFVSWWYLFSRIDLGTTDWEEAKRISVAKAKVLIEKGLSDIASLAELEIRA